MKALPGLATITALAETTGHPPRETEESSIRRRVNERPDDELVIDGDSAHTRAILKSLYNPRYFGIEVNDQSLVPGPNPRLGSTHFADWLSRSAAHKTV